MSSLKYRLKSAIPPAVKESLRRLLSPWYIDRITITHPEITFELIGDPVERFDLPDWSFHGNHEPIVTRDLVDLLRGDSEKVFWDIGSKYGYFAVLASNLMTKRENIHVFEPDPKHLAFIRRNNREYADGEMQVNPVLVGEASGEGMVSLDDYLTQNECPDIIKIDVDGAEESVLSGMQSVLTDCRPILFLEVHFFEGYEKRKSIVENVLANSEYNCKICKEHRIEGAEWEDVELQDLPLDESAIPERAESQVDYMLKCIPR